MEKFEKQLSYYKVELTREEEDILLNTSEIEDLAGNKLIDLRKLVEVTISKTNIAIDFRIHFEKKGTLGAGSFGKEARLRQMEKDAEDEAKRIELEHEKDSLNMELDEPDTEFSQFESSNDGDGVVGSKFGLASKKSKMVKDKFGRKFLDIFQKSLIS